MKNNSLIEKKINEALSSIDNIKPAIASPYFYNKVLYRLRKVKLTLWERWSGFFLRPSIAFASVCLIVVVNTFVLYTKYDNNTYHPDQTEVASSDEYSETVTSFYDLENVNP